jgi:hypothetical protein
VVSAVVPSSLFSLFTHSSGQDASLQPASWRLRMQRFNSFHDAIEPATNSAGLPDSSLAL